MSSLKLKPNSKTSTQALIDKLRDDAAYYGEFGRTLMSNSDVGVLLDDPKNFGKPKEKTKPMLEGSYLHALLIEPQKAEEFIIVDASTRNTKEYKQQIVDSEQEILLLRDEATALRSLAESFKANYNASELIYNLSAEYEQPMVGELRGMLFKGKADVVTDDYIIDIKTTSSLRDFRFSARKYHYDSQAYIYTTLLGKPMKFVVIDKETHLIGIFDTSEEFLLRGSAKVDQALDLYNQYYGETPTSNISQLTIFETI